ncbi:MAG: UvrD-helicase domain-containing protein [Saprospiraceae bacterium]
MRNIIESKNSPTIVYVSRTKKADDIANRLTNDGFLARPFHGKLASKIKTENQNAFISGEVPIMVATSAFGMGVDKKNIQSVIHYDISDSLENYVQEAGRAGRDEHLQADCYILYNEEDLNKHFILQNSTKLTIKEINQIWKAIKEMTWYRNTVSNSALEIAREAGWDDTVGEIETRVTTAIAALEEAGYLKRNQNQASVYANSIQSRNAQEAIELINQSMLFTEFEKISGIRMIKYLIGSKRRSLNDEGEAESRVDYIADLLSIPNKEVIHIVDLLRQENILADQMDLTAYIIRGENQSRIAKKVKTFNGILRFFYSHCDDETLEVNLKQVKKELQEHETLEADINQLRISLLYLGMKGMIKFRYWDPAKNNANILFTETSISFVRHLEILEFLAPLITQFLIDKSKLVIDDREEVLVEFSVGEIMAYVEKSNQLFNRACSVSDVEDCLFYLAKIKAINIEGGFMIVYKRIRLERIELKNSIRYKKEDYKKLEQYYESKIQQVHIVGEYASKMISDYVGALNFVEDYFSLNYSLFLNKYFPGSRQDDIKRTITPQKFRQLFGTVSALQLEIIKDLNKKAAVLAGPGSGKTRVLVHKLASIFLMEEIKHEQILMLTFSRAAVTEFRKRLHALIGNATSFIEIKTFHSYCFDLLGRVGDLSMADNVIKEAVTAIKDQIIDKFRITKLVMLIDEAQDINKDEYELIQTLLSQNEDMRVIMVGDDDQNIFEFRGSNSAYLQDFINNQKATTFELVENYRSGRNLVEFINAFAFTIRGRLKKRPILSVTEKEGQVKIIRYAFKHLALPVVEQIRLNPSKGDTCILTRTNIEASQIHRILKRTGVRTRLVQSNEGFSLSNLKEVRFILKLLAQESIPIISNNYWVKIKQTLKSDFQSSKWYPMVARMLSDFELSNPKTKYVSDLESFLSESQMEDFLFDEKDTVFVSTYHKAKGKEFENVHVVVTAIDQTEKSKRTLYVAMTRAKDNLVIHVHGNYFDHFVSDHVTLLQDNANYGQPDELSFQLTHAHILLSYFSSVQEIVKKLTSGDILLPNEDGCTTPEGQFVLRYSKKFIEEEKKFTSGGYIRKSASVNFLVFWEAPDKKEILIVLPEIIYQKH